MQVWRCPATLAQIMSRHCCTLAYYGTVEMDGWGVSALVGYTIFTEDQWEVGGVMHSRNLVVIEVGGCRAE